MKKFLKYTAGKQQYIKLALLLVIVIASIGYSISKLASMPGSTTGLVFYSIVSVMVILLSIACFLDIFRQQRIADAVKNQIARDLHDDLGNSINSIKIYAALASQDTDSIYVKKLRETADDAMVVLKDMIWKLDGSSEAVCEFGARIKCYAGTLCKAAGIDFHLDIASEAFHYEISNEEKKNLYLIIKEAITNSIRYSLTKEIYLMICLQHGKPVIRIKDNGKGCKMEEMKKGYGMRNMRTRASAINYQLFIHSNNGTMIELQKC